MKIKSINAKYTERSHKLDSPSGTAITLKQQMINKTYYNLDRVKNNAGNHQVTYKSDDTIEIKHTANNRNGFAWEQ